MKQDKLTRAGRKFLKNLRVGTMLELDFSRDSKCLPESTMKWTGHLVEVVETRESLEDGESNYVRVWNPEILKCHHNFCGTKEEAGKREPALGWANLNWLKYPVPKGTQLELFPEQLERYNK